MHETYHPKVMAQSGATHKVVESNGDAYTKAKPPTHAASSTPASGSMPSQPLNTLLPSNPSNLY